MGEKKIYCLRLNNSKSNMKTWQELQVEKDFCDITLACDDDKQILAHKMVLSYSSPVFKSILKQNNTQHPLIYLTGIKNKDLQNLINFLYKGEVNVAEEDLENFLKVVDDLKIKGISASKVNSPITKSLAKRKCSEEKPSEKSSTYNMQKLKTSKENIGEKDLDNFSKLAEKEEPADMDDDESEKSAVIDDVENEESDDMVDDENEESAIVDDDEKEESADMNDIDDTKEVIDNNDKTMDKKGVSADMNGLDGTENIRDNEIEDTENIIDNNDKKLDEKEESEWSTMIKNLMKKKSVNGIDDTEDIIENNDQIQLIKSIPNSFQHQCEQCDYKTMSKGNLKTHVQAIHELILYPCNQCNYQANQKSHLKRHTQSQHEGIRYPCKHCQYKATEKGHLKKHIESIHEGVRYPCGQCEYTSGFKGRVKRHIQSVHEGRRYSCFQCEYTVAEKSTLTKHVKANH